MPEKQRASIQRLQETIRAKRKEVGLPKNGPVPPRRLLEALKKDPPIDKLVDFVRHSLAEDPLERYRTRTPQPERKPFDKRA